MGERGRTRGAVTGTVTGDAGTATIRTDVGTVATAGNADAGSTGVGGAAGGAAAFVRARNVASGASGSTISSLPTVTAQLTIFLFTQRSAVTMGWRRARASSARSR